MEDVHKGSPWLLLNSEMVDMNRHIKDLAKDREAIELFLREHVQPHSYVFDSIKEQVLFMTAQGYYELAFIQQYQDEDIEEIFSYARHHWQGFRTLTAAIKAYQDYVVKEPGSGRYLESFSDRLSVIALYHADGNIQVARKIIESLIQQDFIPATPTLLNTGRRQRGEFVSCFLLEMGDSLNDINRTLDFAGQLSKMGGGVAINFSNIRARGESVNGYDGASKGVSPLMKVFDVLFRYVDQQGQRPGAGVAYLPVFHADVLEFLSIKKINTDQDSRLTTLSIGLIIPSKFIELFHQKEKMALFSPHSIYREYGVNFSDVISNFDLWYDQLVANVKIPKKWIDPMIIFSTLAQTWAQSGYPYIFFIDNANKTNMIDGKIRQSNLCTEIMQVAKPSHYGFFHQRESDIIGSDVTCTLTSGHIENMIQHDSISETIFSAMTVMNHVNHVTSIDHVPSIAKGNRQYRSVGFGIMGLHGFLVAHDMIYGSSETLEFVDVFFNAVNYWSLRISCDMAKVHGSFDGFEKSGYANGMYFHNRGEILPRSHKVKRIFASITDLPRDKEWKALAKDVQTYGLYNAYRLAIAPTGSIAYVMSATPSVTPVKNIVEERVYSKSRTFYPAPHLEDSACADRYETAYDIKKRAIIDTLAVIQKHIDQGISFELCVQSNDFRASHLINTLLYAHDKGLKSIYYVRINKMQLEECLSCQI
ncbi:class 1b ribonucleoside-diphosphate reductase subunit alpha [Entomospira entomophila]|uniref:Ribonucleoside-diphosphate reductase n=1 Tax=Entomospira entomophila TaxID=2719988 RepID=A0A968G9C2_9SPIO|nr:class 1b ribonucleoside-diphosphate reductase subunit alpha [Entomospira entomophilus]NIZ40968.1 class 1b ribonucleoside-diphosphate reductase subunit alpha [Entomospira entomophilus]WDI35181.1 class 1b ribonucleoside-diphosphate reductase subunit alpha [Entomospira entomophilus]